MSSLIEQFIDVVKVRVQTVSPENDYATRVSQVVLPRRSNDWQPLDGTVIIQAGTPQRAPESDRPGNPPAIGNLLSIEVSAIVIPSSKDPRSWDAVVSEFATDVQKSITNWPDWHTFGDRSFNAGVGPIKLNEPGDESPGSAVFQVNIIYRTSETDPNEIRG